jgi:hypothetical protein
MQTIQGPSGFRVEGCMRSALVLCAALTGCLFTTPGIKRTLDFQAVVDDQVTGGWAVMAIAPNTAVTIRGMVHRGSQPVLITEWWAEEPSVISVERDGEDRVKVLGLSPGKSKLWIRAGYTEDLLEIAVVQPVAIDVLPPLSSTKRDVPLAAVVGESGEVPLFHQGPNREAVLALGIMPNVALEPADLATKVAPGPRSGARLQLSFERPGRLALIGGAGPTLDVTVMDRSAITELRAEPATKGSDPGVATLLVQVGVEGRLATLITGGFAAEVTTPEVCALAGTDMALETKRMHGPGAFTVVASAAGKCEGAVKLGELKAPFAVQLAPRGPG